MQKYDFKQRKKYLSVLSGAEVKGFAQQVQVNWNWIISENTTMICEINTQKQFIPRSKWMKERKLKIVYCENCIKKG